jgi:hypothetical protein
MRTNNPLVNFGEPLLDEMPVKREPGSEIQEDQNRSENGANSKRQNQASPGVHVDSPVIVPWVPGAFVVEEREIEHSQASTMWVIPRKARSP